MNDNELKKVLENHRLWIIGKKNGQRADLQDADLSGADLSGAKFFGAYLYGANLQCADLSGADLNSVYLSGADLSGAKLFGAKLFGANLFGANLQCADLHSAKNIYSFGPVGFYSRIGYAVKHDTCVMIKLGCFWGTSEQAIIAVSKKYGVNSLYQRQIELAVQILQEQE